MDFILTLLLIISNYDYIIFVTNKFNKTLFSFRVKSRETKFNKFIVYYYNYYY